MNLPLVTTPKYTLTLPSTGKKYEYRPFLVGEQKLLMLALETGEGDDIINSIHQVIDICTFNKLNCKILPSFDTEYIFIKLRSKSIGEKLELNVTCKQCDAKNDYELDLDSIKVIKPKNHTTKIQLTPNMGVIMRYPTTEETDLVKARASVDTIYDVVANCIEQIYDDETVYMTKDFTKEEVSAWIDKLTQDQFDKIETFFENMPRVETRIEFKCKKCKEDNVILVEGIDTFFA